MTTFLNKMLQNNLQNVGIIQSSAGCAHTVHTTAFASVINEHHLQRKFNYTVLVCRVEQLVVSERPTAQSCAILE